MKTVHECIKVLIDGLSKCDPQVALYHRETVNVMHARWSTLDKDLYNEDKGSVDFSKLPDIYDSVKFDVLHNLKTLEDNGVLTEPVSLS